LKASASMIICINNMIYTKRLVFAALLALLCATSAKAASLFKEEFDFGAYGYKADSVAYMRGVSTNVVAGMELNVTKNPSLPDVVYSVRMPFIVNLDGGMFLARPFYYHPTALVDTSATGIYAQRIFNLPSDDRDIKLRAAFSLGAASQNTRFSFADGTSLRKDLPELVYEGQFQEDCFREFFLSATGTLFQYADSVSGVEFPQAAMDQNQVASLGMIASETGLPQWSGGFDFTRTMPDDKDSTVHIGYRHIEYVSPQVHPENLALLGLHYKYKERASMDFTYNWMAWGGQPTRNYYRVTFDFGF